jgi:hypothetical protein
MGRNGKNNAEDLLGHLISTAEKYILGGLVLHLPAGNRRFVESVLNT